ncbi:MAG TPA: phospholipase C, phosphocholine-specific [Micromonosporaceae bacterium]|jgi:phospholipase C
MTGVSRRTLIASGAALAGAAATGGALTASTSDAATPAAPSAKTVGAVANGRTGTVKDVQHVVILMQENRSFDHYFGTLGGVRGFGDTKAVRYPDGTTTFDQPDSSRSNKVLRPFRMDTSKYNAQQASDLDHSWAGTHEAANGGAWNKWVGAKGFETMGYFTRSDLPWQYALADAFTVCDAYHCSVQGPTIPNRLHMWTGTNDPNGKAGGPVTINPTDFYTAHYKWTTYPERLQAAGVSWQVYANTEVGYGDWLGDFGDNPLWLFHAYHDAQSSSDPKVRELAERASVVPWQPDAGKGHSVSHVLSRFIADCKAGTLPTVSYVVAPRLYSEHPKARPVDGAAYISGVLEAIWANTALWESTVVLLNYDENDGFFDHEVPPMAPAGTADEYIDGEVQGLGPRLPLTVVSPWSHGGWVNSQVCDHTSIVRFLEVVTGVHEPNISTWRRTVCGDLTSCFDFTAFDPTVPHLPSVTALVAAADAEQKLAPVKAPGSGTQKMPVQETTTRKHRPLPYGPAVGFVVEGVDRVTLALSNTGTEAISFAMFRAEVTPFAPLPFVVGAGKTTFHTMSTVHTGGRYNLAVHGPNGFLHSYSGLADGVHASAEPLADGRLRLTLRNPGASAASFVVGRSRHHVPAGERSVIDVPTDDGWYDVTVTAAGLVHRYAGRIEVAAR